MSTFLAHIANLAVGWLMSAWMLMLGVGVVHAEWIPQLPTIGFGLAMLLAFLLLIRALVGATLGAIGGVINGESR